MYAAFKAVKKNSLKLSKQEFTTCIRACAFIWGVLASQINEYRPFVFVQRVSLAVD
jgi:hypothetical protein